MPTGYRAGETVTCHHWDDAVWNSGGIYFYLTRVEAEGGYPAPSTGYST